MLLDIAIVFLFWYFLLLCFAFPVILSKLLMFLLRRSSNHALKTELTDGEKDWELYKSTK